MSRGCVFVCCDLGRLVNLFGVQFGHSRRALPTSSYICGLATGSCILPDIVCLKQWTRGLTFSHGRDNPRGHIPRLIRTCSYVSFIVIRPLCRGRRTKRTFRACSRKGAGSTSPQPLSLGVHENDPTMFERVPCALGARRTLLIRWSFDSTQLSMCCTPSHRGPHWLAYTFSPIQFGSLRV